LEARYLHGTLLSRAGQRALRERWLARLDRREAPAFVDVVAFVLRGRDVAELFVEPFVVVEADPGQRLVLGVLEAREDAAGEELGLKVATHASAIALRLLCQVEAERVAQVGAEQRVEAAGE
jgi:hypothetical protein